MRDDQVKAVDFNALIADVLEVRSLGAGNLRGALLPALRQATTQLDLADPKSTEPAPIVDLLHQALERFGDGELYQAAAYSLGLERGTGLWSAVRRRTAAADSLGLRPETYRKKPERQVMNQVAEAVLQLLHDNGMRRARVEMESHRHPADSRLAVQWVERFEAYYRMWTPVYALGETLDAAIDTYHEEPSDHLPWDPNSKDAYDPVRQAQGYARSALYYLAQFSLELKRFMNQHGGLWLLSDTDTEQTVADTVYRIGWHNDFPQEDLSFLRRQLADSRHEEQDHFWQLVQSFPQGKRIELKWQKMVYEAAHASTDAERQASQALLTIESCRQYCDLIDQDWLKIADWYRPGSTPSRGIRGADLYDQLISLRSPKNQNTR